MYDGPLIQGFNDMIPTYLRFEMIHGTGVDSNSALGHHSSGGCFPNSYERCFGTLKGGLQDLPFASLCYCPNMFHFGSSPDHRVNAYPATSQLLIAIPEARILNTWENWRTQPARSALDPWQ